MTHGLRMILRNESKPLTVYARHKDGQTVRIDSFDADLELARGDMRTGSNWVHTQAWKVEDLVPFSHRRSKP
jgi:hypothetical protein